MKETERFIRRATRSLWGQARRDAALELRGAVEDKLYRYSLLGLSAPEAERAALRDLGSPSAIARELGTVHSLPQGVKVGLFAGLAGLLSFQALAQVPTVRAIPTPAAERAKQMEFCDYSPAAIAKAAPEIAQYMRNELTRVGSAEKARANCLASQPNPNRYLRLSDLLSALKAGGVKVDQAAPGLLTVEQPGGTRRSAVLGDDSRTVGGELYVSKYQLLDSLLRLLDGPARLSGAVNPVLTIGTVGVQLGTPQTPLATGDLLSFLVSDVLEERLAQATPPQESGRAQPVRLAMTEDTGGVGEADMTVPGVDGTLYAVVSNGFSISSRPPCDCAEGENFYLLSIQPVRQGKVPQPSAVDDQRRPQPLRIVRTPQELVQATAKREHAALLYRLDTSNLRSLKYFPVSPGEVKLLKASWQK